VNDLTEEKTQESQSRIWIAVLAVVIVVAIIGLYSMAPGQAPPVKAPENSVPVAAAGLTHTISWKNDCTFPVWVDIQGGTLYYPNPSDKKVKLSACQPTSAGTCVPTTKCSGVAYGDTHQYKCDQGDDMVDGGGFKLDAGGSHSSQLVRSWQGAFWGRTGCVDNSDGSLTCEVGDCWVYKNGKGALQCGGQGPYTFHLTKGEFNLNELGSDTDFYDVSLVDGYNIPMRMELTPGSFSNGANTNKDYDCTVSEANTDLLPLFAKSGLSTTKIGGYVSNNLVSIESACAYANANDPAHIPQFCCLGDYGPGKCDPSTWQPADIRTAPFFKQYNPRAYSFAYNDPTSTFMCKNKDANTLTSYTVTFCPGKSADNGAGSGPAQTIAPVNTPVQVTTMIPTMTPAPSQSQVPKGPFNPAATGGANF
jgi:hypothetical protein